MPQHVPSIIIVPYSWKTLPKVNYISYTQFSKVDSSQYKLRYDPSSLLARWRGTSLRHRQQIQNAPLCESGTATLFDIRYSHPPFEKQRVLSPSRPSLRDGPWVRPDSAGRVDQQSKGLRKDSKRTKKFEGRIQSYARCKSECSYRLLHHAARGNPEP